VVDQQRACLKERRREAAFLLVAVHESENGTSRHFAGTQNSGRFRGEADIEPDIGVHGPAKSNDFSAAFEPEVRIRGRRNM
jgi:hypothetical protein